MKFEEILAAARMWGPGKSGICTPETLTRFEKFEGIGFYTDRIGALHARLVEVCRSADGTQLYHIVGSNSLSYSMLWEHLLEEWEFIASVPHTDFDRF